MDQRLKSPSLVESSIHRLLSLEPVSPPSNGDYGWSSSLDFDLNSLGEGSTQTISRRADTSTKNSTSMLPAIDKISTRFPSSSKPAPARLAVKDLKLFDIDSTVARGFLTEKCHLELPADSESLQRISDSREAQFSKISVTSVGLTDESLGTTEYNRHQYILKPFSGKHLSKSILAPRSLSPIGIDSRESLFNKSFSLSPISSRAAFPINVSPNQPESVENNLADGLLSRSSVSLQIGLPEDDSRLNSPNLQVPVLPLTHFDDEGIIVSEFQSERDPSLQPDDCTPNNLDNPFSLDISEKPIKDKGESIDMLREAIDREEKRNNFQFQQQEKPKVLEPKTFAVAPFASTIEEHPSTTSISTLGERNVVPFAVHKRVLGWKLTSVEKRRELIDIFDSIHGRASADQTRRLRSSQILKHGNKTTDGAIFSAFHVSNSTPNLAPAMQPTMKNSLQMKSREVIAFEGFVSRSISSRQGFKNVQQIKNFAEDQRKKKVFRSTVIAAQKSTPQSHLENSYARVVDEDDGVKSIAVRPYIPVGTLTPADKFGKSKDSTSLLGLLAEALFSKDDDEDVDEKDQSKPRLTAVEKMYKFPVGIHRPRSRMDILESVQTRKDLEPSIRGTPSWKEDQLVDAFIAGRQNARLRRNRDHSDIEKVVNDSKAKNTLKTDLLGDNWDDDSVLTLSTSAEENEQALSEALLENFGLSLQDDDLVDGDFEKQFSNLAQGSALESEAGTNPISLPSLHPLQPRDSGLARRSSLDDDASWPDD